MCSLFIKRGSGFSASWEETLFDTQGRRQPEEGLDFRRALGEQPTKMPSLLPSIFSRPLWGTKGGLLASGGPVCVDPAGSITLWLGTRRAAGAVHSPAMQPRVHVVIPSSLVALKPSAAWKVCFENPSRV